MLDLEAATSALYARLATDSEGATARGYIPAVVTAAALEGYVDALSLPSLPLAAFRAGAVTGNDRDGYRIPFAWWLYDTASKGFIRINRAVGPLIAAYPSEDALTGGLYVTFTGVSPERPDASLFSMPARAVSFVAYTRQ